MTHETGGSRATHQDDRQDRGVRRHDPYEEPERGPGDMPERHGLGEETRRSRDGRRDDRDDDRDADIRAGYR